MSIKDKQPKFLDFMRVFNVLMQVIEIIFLNFRNTKIISSFA
jgi:hypothetical protein